MMDFNRDSLFNLHRIKFEEINKNIPYLMLEGEKVVGAYRTVRDQIVFTDRRIILLNIKGITGKRKEMYTIPYCKIQYFAVQTVGFMELFPDAELTVFFANGKCAIFEFKGDNDILEIGQVLSRYTLTTLS